MSSAEVALHSLKAISPSERLAAARYFAANAESEHLFELRKALAKEKVSWVRRALEEAIGRCGLEATDTADDVVQPQISDDLLLQIQSRALQTTTGQIIHEIEPLIGRLKLAARDEIPDYPDSATSRAIQRLDSFLAALARLRRAASAPKFDEFPLDELVQEVISDNSDNERIIIQASGPEHFIVVGDRGLVQLCLSNGIRNAIEATAALDDEDVHPIVVTWSSTDTHNWVSIVDNGIGFKGNIQRALEIGTTTKDGHFGMGLAIVQQSIVSMSGRLDLVPNPRGVRFEIQWPNNLGEA